MLHAGFQSILKLVNEQFREKKKKLKTEKNTRNIKQKR